MHTAHLHHYRVQHPVGQGSFHSGAVELGGACFRYIYDCGAAKRDKRFVIQEASTFGQHTRSVDVLFLSHLDEDHISGVEHLLETTSVRIVVLPYLSPFERVVLLAKTVARTASATAAASASTVALQPYAWLKGLGVQRCVFVRPRFGGAATEEMEPQYEEPDVPIGNIELEVDFPNADEPSEAVMAAVGAGLGDDIVIMPSGPIFVKAGPARVWTLLPQVHPDKPGTASFRFKAATQFGLSSRPLPRDSDPVWLDAIRACIDDQQQMKKLGSLYKTHFSNDRNLSTLSLYSGPARKIKGPVLCSSSRISIAIQEITDGRVGWMGTGDANFGIYYRLREFKRFYSEYLPMTKTFALPHHGSGRSLDERFIRQNAGVVWVASYGTTNTYKHPGKRLMRAAKETGHGVRVNEFSKHLVEHMCIDC